VPLVHSVLVTPVREELAQRATDLAAQGVYVGTSSWKYPGCFGQIYNRDRYEYRGKFAQTRFNRDCLWEYAEVSKPFASMRLITISPASNTSKEW
jgi:hypothetical protein